MLAPQHDRASGGSSDRADHAGSQLGDLVARKPKSFSDVRGLPLGAIGLVDVLIHRCPRCRAQDITVDAHPTRIVNNGRVVPILVCRNCYRQAELELRIACETADLPLGPMPIRDGLRLLADHYLDRLAALDDPDLLLEDDQRAALKRPITDALEEVRRKLALGPVRD